MKSIRQFLSKKNYSIFDTVAISMVAVSLHDERYILGFVLMLILSYISIEYFDETENNIDL